MAEEQHMGYAGIYEPRQIVGVIILAAPIILIAWGWIRPALRRPSDPPMVLWIPSVVFLVLLTIGYGLTLAQIFSSRLEQNFFNLWHTSDMALYLLISFLACPFAWKGKSPIRWQVFGTGIYLTVLYSALAWSMME